MLICLCNAAIAMKFENCIEISIQTSKQSISHKFFNSIIRKTTSHTQIIIFHFGAKPKLTINYRIQRWIPNLDIENNV